MSSEASHTGEQASGTDANDYSRFDDIPSDSEEEEDTGSKADSDTKADDKPAAERLQEAGTAKMRGNDAFKAQDNQAAADAYREGLSALDSLAPLPSSTKGTKDGKSSKPSKTAVPPTAGELAESRELWLSLQLNLAMAEIKLKNWKSAIDATSKALKVDEKNIKALFRRGVAQSRFGVFEAAKADLTAALALDPTNTAAKKELQIVRKKMQEHKAATKKNFSNLFERAGGVYDDREQERKDREARKRKAEAEERAEYERECDKRKEAGDDEITFKDWKDAKEKAAKEAKEAAEKREKERREQEQEARRKEREASKADKEQLELDEDDEDIMKELKRGYCYFRRQQSAEEKSLIGDIAPKKVAEEPSPLPAAQPVTATASPTPPKASAWNSEGTTWEEKDCSSWAKDTLERHLKAAAGQSTGSESMVDALSSMDLSGAASSEAETLEKLQAFAGALVKASATVTKVSKVEGDASVAVVRGRTRYIFDLSAEVDYEVQVDDPVAAKGDKPKTCKYRGKMILRDIANDDEIEVQVKPKGAAPKAEHASKVQEAVQSLKSDILTRKIPGFSDEFKAAH